MSLSAESSTLFPTPLARGTVSGGDPVTVSLVPWPPPLDDGGSGQMKGINALIAAIKFQINGSLFFPGTPIQKPTGGTLGGSLSCSPSTYCFFCTQVPRWLGGPLPLSLPLPLMVQLLSVHLLLFNSPSSAVVPLASWFSCHGSQFPLSSASYSSCPLSGSV